MGWDRPVRVLLVDDSKADQRLTEEALKEGPINTDLFTVEDGVEALSFLRREGDFSESPRPDIILLDLNMPRKNGREVLMELKTDPQLRSIPVLVLTTSQSEDDIKATYGLHANCFITKPLELDDYIKAIQSILDFWLGVVKLPT